MLEQIEIKTHLFGKWPKGKRCYFPHHKHEQKVIKAKITCIHEMSLRTFAILKNNSLTLTAFWLKFKFIDALFNI